VPWLDLLPSRLVGGFEGSTMVLTGGERVDSAAGNRHDLDYEKDYDLLSSVGVRAVRESLRWYRIERRPGKYDASEFVKRLRALQARGMRAIWSLTQFGLPDWLDIWSSEFPEIFAAYARSAGETFRAESDAVPIWSPINEISYWCWASAKARIFAPAATGRVNELKRQLVAAAVAASRALRAVDARARLVHVEPLLNVVRRRPPTAIDPQALEGAGVFEAWDMLSGRREPALGGATELLDIVGVNFYPDNQRFLDGSMVPFGHPCFVPFHKLAGVVAARYGRPLLVSETGTEGPAESDWLRYMAAEVGKAASSLPFVGFCLYPVIDYPGWIDKRHCRCGLIACDPGWSIRRLRSNTTAMLGDVGTLLG
jgi:Glycosyl hydrolase family 1